MSILNSQPGQLEKPVTVYEGTDIIRHSPHGFSGHVEESDLKIEL